METAHHKSGYPVGCVRIIGTAQVTLELVHLVSEVLLQSHMLVTEHR